jgi:predicted NACHT family NTPase
VNAGTSYLIKKIADFGFARAIETLRKSKARLESESDDIERALDFHLRNVKNWSSEISFSDLRSAKSTPEVFVPLDVFLHPRRRHVSKSEATETMSLEGLLKHTLTPKRVLPDTPASHLPARHLIILGQPGAGKTTSMKHLCHRLLYEEEFLGDLINLPLLVRLQELNPRARASEIEKVAEDDSLLSLLQAIVGLRISYSPDMGGDENRTTRRNLRDRVVIDFLDNMNALIVLDGFDEIIARSRKDVVISQIRVLATQLEQSCIILTSRTGEFNYHLDKMAQFELTPLSQSQIQTFCSRWLGTEDGDRLLANRAAILRTWYWRDCQLCQQGLDLSRGGAPTRTRRPELAGGQSSNSAHRQRPFRPL